MHKLSIQFLNLKILNLLSSNYFQLIKISFGAMERKSKINMMNLMNLKLKHLLKMLLQIQYNLNRHLAFNQFKQIVTEHLKVDLDQDKM